MGVYIRGMEMPKACVYYKNGHMITCPLYDIDGYCGALNTEAIHEVDGMLDNCPLVPVPEHGRLIDADVQDAQIEALIERHLHGYTKSTWDFVCELRDILKRNRTIIPAEEGET